VKNIEKSNTKTYSSENGQTLVFVVLVLFVLFGMLALVLDGGMAYAQRRTAQNAADAGALAGVVYLCESSTNQIMAETAAIEYAGRNSVNDVLVSFPATRQIEVEASVTFSTFFEYFWSTRNNCYSKRRCRLWKPWRDGRLAAACIPMPNPCTRIGQRGLWNCIRSRKYGHSYGI
jgi:uncharacterized membrane protein